MTITVTQETANLVNTLANAASQIGSTPASAKINKLIVDILPEAAEEKNYAEIAESLRLNNIALKEELEKERASMTVMQANLELARSQLQQIADVMLTIEGVESPFIGEIRDILSIALSPVNA